MSKATENFSLSAHVLAQLLRRPFERDAWMDVTSIHLHLRIGNNRPAIGRDVALAAFASFRGRLTLVDCRYSQYWEERDAILVETDVCFLDASGRPQEIPCAVVARTPGGMLEDLRLYLDPSPIP